MGDGGDEGGCKRKSGESTTTVSKVASLKKPRTHRRITEHDQMLIEMFSKRAGGHEEVDEESLIEDNDGKAAKDMAWNRGVVYSHGVIPLS